jgi:hypothetical protein
MPFAPRVMVSKKCVYSRSGTTIAVRVGFSATSSDSTYACEGAGTR